MDIQVILTENDPKLGKRGQVIKVSSGYAQNFLFPHLKAKPATEANLKQFEREKAKTDKVEAERLAEANALADRIQKLSLSLLVSAGDGDKLFGAVTTQDLCEALAKEKIICERRQIHLPEPLKKLGRYEIDIKLHPEVHAKLRVELQRQ